LGKWECYRCSYVTEAENPPEECPSCHYSVTFWIGHVDDKQEEKQQQQPPLTVKNFVRTNLLKLDINESAWHAARLMRENDAGSVLITVSGVPMGIVTERDILYKIAAEDLLASNVLLKKVMSTTIFSTTSDTPITDALKMMAKHHIRRLLVTEDGKPIGMVSQRSILGGSFRLARDTMEDIDVETD
jgi:CBS domain-containing protein